MNADKRQPSPLLLALFLVAAPAFAWPVDVYVSELPGKETFQKAAGTEWVEVKDASVAEVEALPGDEALVTVKKDGRTLALLYGEGRMGVWMISAPPRGVGTPRVPTIPECPGTRFNPSSATDKLVVNVKTEVCRKALLALFKGGTYHSREITLTFELPVMQSQLREIQRAIDAAIGAEKVEALYAGGSLRLKGNLTTAEHKKVLWTVFDHAVGRVTLDDRLVLTDKPVADAGTKP